MWNIQHRLHYIVLFLFLLLRTTRGFSYDYENGYLRDLSPNWAVLGGSLNQPKCVEIPQNMTLCADIGYREMRIPNLLEHDNLKEIVQQSGPWVPLLNLQCHPDTQLFLCSLYSPVCLDRAIFPCRSLCESVKRGCEARMNAYNYPWPEILRCDKFPLDKELCIEQVNFEDAQNSCIPCKQPETYESLMDNYCWADFVVRGKVKRSTADGDNKQLTIQVRKSKDIYKANNISESELRRISALLIGGNACECGSLEDTNIKKLIMGRRDGAGLVVTYISTFRTKGPFKREYKKAKKSFSQDHDCTAQIRNLTQQKSENKVNGNNNNSENSNGRRRGKDRKRKKKKKNKKGKKKDRKNKKKKGRKDRKNRRNPNEA